MKFEDKYEDAGSDFIKLDDGDVETGVFAGDPYQFQVHANFPDPSTLCIGLDCPLCLSNHRPTTKFRINFIIKQKSGAYKAKIFEQGYYTWETLKKLSKRYDLSKHTVELSREGKKKDTRYFITPLPEGKLTGKSIENLEKVELVNLYHEGVEPEEKSIEVPLDGEPKNFDATEDIPF